MKTEKIAEISRVIVDEHAEDVGRWMADLHFSSPLYQMLDRYQTAQFWMLREMREYLEGQDA